MKKSLLKKSLVVGIICLLMLVSLPTSFGTVEYYENMTIKNNRSERHFVFIRATSLIGVGFLSDYYRIGRFLELFLSTDGGHVQFRFGGGANILFIVDGKIQDVETPVKIDFGLEGLEKGVAFWWHPLGKTRIVGVVDAIEVIEG